MLPVGHASERTARTVLSMTSKDAHRTCEIERATAWKASTPTLSDDERVDAPYIKANGTIGKKAYSFCLPVDSARKNLLPEVRDFGIDLFDNLKIPWHAGKDGGPGNHLLSSQVQCVNALGQMVIDPQRIVAAFGPALGTASVHEIEEDRWLTFEYIGEHDVLGEAKNGVRRRGTQCTSVDAAFLHTTTDGVRELVLVEWKYIEQYRKRDDDPAGDATRRARYQHLVDAPDGPIHGDKLEFDELLQEPLYQLMRQQLLAHELEKAGAHGVDRVRVAHVLPPANVGYQRSLYGSGAKALGGTVDEVWQQLLRHTDRFVHIDPAVFLDPAVTSAEYVARYG